MENQQEQITFILYMDRYHILQFPRELEVQKPSIEYHQFVSLTYLPDEVLLICPQQEVPENATEVSGNWRVLQIKGAFDPGQVDILKAVAHQLQEGDVSLFLSSSFDTDYLLINHLDLNKALAILRDNNYEIEHRYADGSVGVDA